MNNEITAQLMCISIRNGIEIWVENERAKKLVAVLVSPNPPQFVEFDGRIINRADIVGVFSADDLGSATRRKNGEWSCRHGEWHSKGEKCACLPRKDREAIARRQQAIEACGKCENGWVAGAEGVRQCPCLTNL